MTMLFFFILILHGAIHLLGGIKAFRDPDYLQEISLSISRVEGLVWLADSLIFFAAAGLFILAVEWWWVPSIIAVIISQGLVISAWRDAKYGSLPNIIILVVSVIACANWLFARQIESDTELIFTPQSEVQQQRINDENITDLPGPVRKWLDRSGVIGSEPVSRVRLTQKGELRTEPGQSSWSDASSEQHFNVEVPAFIWSVEMEMMPFVYVTGRDLLFNGDGEMLVKLYSLFDVVNESGEKIDRGALQRYLSEIVWFPSAAVRDYISWTAIDSTTASASITSNRITERVVFHFNESGDISGVSASRFMGGGKEALRRPWYVSVLKTEEMNGRRIPTEVEVSWELDSGLFTWYRFRITGIEYTL